MNRTEYQKELGANIRKRNREDSKDPSPYLTAEHSVVESLFIYLQNPETQISGIDRLIELSNTHVFTIMPEQCSLIFDLFAINNPLMTQKLLELLYAIMYFQEKMNADIVCNQNNLLVIYDLFPNILAIEIMKYLVLSGKFNAKTVASLNCIKPFSFYLTDNRDNIHLIVSFLSAFMKNKYNDLFIEIITPIIDQVFLLLFSDNDISVYCEAMEFIHYGLNNEKYIKLIVGNENFPKIFFLQPTEQWFLDEILLILRKYIFMDNESVSFVIQNGIIDLLKNCLETDDDLMVAYAADSLGKIASTGIEQTQLLIQMQCLNDMWSVLVRDSSMVAILSVMRAVFQMIPYSNNEQRNEMVNSGVMTKLGEVLEIIDYPDVILSNLDIVLEQEVSTNSTIFYQALAEDQTIIDILRQFSISEDYNKAFYAQSILAKYPSE